MIRLTKDELIEAAERYKQSIVNYRLEVEELRAALQKSTNDIKNLQREVSMKADRIRYLSRDLASYHQVCEMLSSELLATRLEMQRMRYDASKVTPIVDQPTPQVEAKAHTAGRVIPSAIRL